MFDTLCTYPLPSDLFAQAIHPSEPIIALGLATGHVSLHRLPPSSSSSSASEPPKNGCGTIDTAWRTRRHKGSCRALTFSEDGAALFSAGVDGVVKVAETETGWVRAKVAVPSSHSSSGNNNNNNPDPPTLLSTSPTNDPSTLLLATESGTLHVYDLRVAPTTTTSLPMVLPTTTTTPSLSLPSIHPPDSSFITSLSPLPPSTHPHQILTTGGPTVSITDLRRGVVLISSADQDEELLASAICDGGNRAVVGGDRGALRVWDVGEWNDEEAVVDVAPGGGGCAVDVLAAPPPLWGDGGGGKGEGMCAVGCDDGVVRFVDVAVGGGGGKGKKNRRVGEVRHDDVEGVVGLGWLRDGRLVSGGGAVVKIWEEAGARPSYTSDDEEGEVEDDDGVAGVGMKRGNGVLGGDDDDDDDDDEGAEVDDSDEDDEPKKRSKKKKKKKKKRSKGGKGKKAQQVGNGIMAFKGLT